MADTDNVNIGDKDKVEAEDGSVAGTSAGEGSGSGTRTGIGTGTISFGLTARKQTKLIDADGFDYIKYSAKKGPDGRQTIWRCQNKKCPARFVYCANTGKGELVIDHDQEEINSNRSVSVILVVVLYYE